MQTIWKLAYDPNEPALADIAYKLNLATPRYHWTIRTWKPFKPKEISEYEHRPMLYNQAILCWNVNGLIGKREHVRGLVAWAKPRIFCLQETNIKGDQFWYTQRGYNIIQHAHSGTGKPGIMMGIAEALSSRKRRSRR